VIEAQINGDPNLDLSIAPWLSWGTYLWSDGVVPRSDGLTWLCPVDCAGDGIHLSYTGGQKLASLLRAPLKSDPTCTSWLIR